jgi:uncharacterized membrane protein YebE (DUF533 family)
MMKCSLLLLSILFLTNCSTATKSTWLGAGIGSVSGGLLGAAIGQNESHEDQNKAIAIGTVVGALAGGLIGQHAYNTQEDKNNKLNSKNLSPPSLEPQAPMLKAPILRRVWLEDKIDPSGTRYETGHWLYIIERQSVWGK